MLYKLNQVDESIDNTMLPYNDLYNKELYIAEEFLNIGNEIVVFSRTKPYNIGIVTYIKEKSDGTIEICTNINKFLFKPIYKY